VLRAALVVVALLATGCGSTSVSQTVTGRHGNAAATRRCTAVSGGFRACTIFRRTGGEESRIERAVGTHWEVFLSANTLRALATAGGGAS
jgi:hypothetical protein